MNKKMIFAGVGVVLVAGAGGWFLRGMAGAKGPGMPGMGGMQMPPPAVNAMEIRPSFLRPAEEFIARVEPVQDVMIRSEISGMIETVHFSEGAQVREGDVLFTIDRRSYQAAADAAEADLLLARRLYERLQKADERSVSKSDLETAESDLLRAQAAFDAAQVDLERTEIKAPVSGRIGSALIKKGNYVTPASGDLARIVQIDPIRVTFSMTDREYLALRQRELAGDGRVRVAQVRLADGSTFDAVGRKDFDDNAINPATGTIAVRYLFENKDQLLLPGGFVTALIRNSDAAAGILIPQKAVLVDQQGAYVLTVDEAGSVGTARIAPGQQVGTGITVLSGLKEGDRIIVDGVQKAQPGATVSVTLLEDK
ncbi:efflux RND transporter periplasmic adaptor subunit [Tichowtungia aerotolerans]|uniref:Efflux RND transporter periplasmic adaptor subunit n=1 Tax=Tichowtungia aerotolerans TaxID=2697043 RepID=A0A6P1M8F8_9BACT|nr:efflux RND transporter periplasmic adaptor subunit [Tichowtungia aerotolerans]QHI69343.1 efflux RND transporter periplasmic adaptor subunit [Tichowtungia aerotolerans]